MKEKTHIIIFAHGFGVKKDDRGLLTDIAKAFPDSITYLFDFFDVNEQDMTITTQPFSEQVRRLKDVYKKAKEMYPDSIVDIVAHSQGTLIPPLSKIEGFRKTILLAPVFDMSIERSLRRYGSDSESKINLEGISMIRKLDGYVRYIPKEYWEERKILRPFDLYNEYASKPQLIIINANQDTILESVDISPLHSNIKVLNIDGGHGFEHEARIHLINIIKEELKY